MTNPHPTASDSVGNLTIAELEALVTRIVNDKLQQSRSPESYEEMIQRIKQKIAEPYDTTAPSFLDIVQALAAQVPDEEWAKIPQDASKRYREYLYGTPNP
jgi:hypothetical protein